MTTRGTATRGFPLLACLAGLAAAPARGDGDVVLAEDLRAFLLGESRPSPEQWVEIVRMELEPPPRMVPEEWEARLRRRFGAPLREEWRRALQEVGNSPLGSERLGALDGAHPNPKGPKRGRRNKALSDLSPDEWTELLRMAIEASPPVESGMSRETLDAFLRGEYQISKETLVWFVWREFDHPPGMVPKEWEARLRRRLGAPLREEWRRALQDVGEAPLGSGWLGALEKIDPDPEEPERERTRMDEILSYLGPDERTELFRRVIEASPPVADPPKTGPRGGILGESLGKMGCPAEDI